MTRAEHLRQSILKQVRRPTFWITVVLYIVLTVGVWGSVSSPLFRAFVEENQSGFLSTYFSKYAGYDVVGAVVRDIRVDIFLVQQVVAALVSILLLVIRKYEAVATGILAVILTFAFILLCVSLMFLMLVRHGY